MTNQCENARVTLSRDNQGRSWEHFWVGDRYQFSNQIPNLKSFTTTNPGWPLADRGLCGWAGTPPPRIPATVDGATAAPTVPTSHQAAASPDAGMASEGAGGLMLLALLGAGIWQWFAKRRQPEPGYNPFADLDTSLPGLGAHGGNFAAKQTHGIRELEADRFAGNSHGFAFVSQDSAPNQQNGSNLGIPQVTEVDEKEWPTSQPLGFDPLQPEQGDEFDHYRWLIEKEGLSAKGVDIIKQLWGCSPGRSRAYAEARKRRDEFAKRLEYYRYEGR